MSILSIQTCIPEDSTPAEYFNKENPTVIYHKDLPAFLYVSPHRVTEHIHELAKKVNFLDYDATLINMNGGKFLYERLGAINGWPHHTIHIEYHEPEGGFGANVVTPVPNELVGRRLLVVDDIRDSGGVSRQIHSDAGGNVDFVFLTSKMGISNQICLPRSSIGFKIENVWIAGCGMDICKKGDLYYPKDAYRDYPGIVVRPDEETLQKLIRLQ